MALFARTPRWIFTLCLWLFSLAAVAASTRHDVGPAPFWPDDAIMVTPFTSVIKVGHNLRYAIADDNTASPGYLRQQPPTHWHLNESATVSLGFQTQPYWFVVNLVTGEDIPTYWILELANTMIDQIDVYLFRNNELLQQWQTGDRLPFKERPIESARFQFPLELQAGHRYQLLIHVASTEALELPLVLANRFDHAILSDRRALVDGVFHGFLIIMAAYSLALYIILQDRSYLFYVAYVTSMLLFFLSQQGLLYELFFPALPLVQHYSVPWVSLLIFLSIAYFFREFLQFDRQLPRLWRAYHTLLVLHGLLCVALLFAQYQTIVMLMALNVSLSMLITFFAICILSWRGSRSAQIVLVGWGLLFTFILLFVFARTGLFYNDFLANYGLRIGITLEILIFSFALSFRINLARREKEWALNNINLERAERIRAQELALQKEIEASQAKEQALQLEIQHREGLQQLVNERTADLERTLVNLENANRELEQLSSRDSLTNLFNRRVFDARLDAFWQAARQKQQPLSLLIIDVDHFKQVNDSRGHQCGDMVLREMAALLRSVLHRPGDVITRYGGEEFAVLLPGTPQNGATHVADVIVRAASDKIYLWEGETFHATVSIGVHTQVPAMTQTPDRLVAAADSALYQAKQEGRNRWVVAHPG